ncbi:MAG: tetratricopeptide repeat protein [Candidatus Eisenbacteria bacterium]|nr:tetratricopeptide repeat protein [Candidatus Eisenbacteria bacterium]
MIGRTIGRYRILEKLGQGGMGTVWKAEDPVLARLVALKFLPPELAGSPEARQRFLREAQVASALEHPGIAAVFDAGEHEGLFYIALACIEGETVSALAARHPIPPIEAIRIAVAAAEALAHAHGRGVIHRDVTGRNIMVARDGRVVVLDFGLALPSEATRLTSSHTLMGTVAYMAPEVAQGGAADARSDLYGLGVVLYEALTGTLPFTGERAEAVLYSAVHEPPVPPGKRASGIPAALDALVLRLLAKNPEHRPGSAAELARELRAVPVPATGEVPTAAMPAPGAPAKPSRKRAAARGAARKTEPKSTPRCLAVLPFRDLGGTQEPDAASRAFAQGVAETVGARLSRLRGLQVIPPSGAGVTPSPDLDLRRVARELGAAMVLSGSVRRAGAQVRVTYNLVDAALGLQMAADTVDGAATDLFGLEDRLAESVLKSLRIEVGSDALHQTATAASGLWRTEARERYLQALGYLQRPEHEASVDGAIALLENLLEAGEGDGEVNAALGRACLHKYEITRSPVWARRATQACGRALESHASAPEVLVTRGNLNRVTGRMTQAVRDFRRALKADPENVDALLGLARTYADTGGYDLAEAACRRALALRPTFWQAHNVLGLSRLLRGAYEQAAEAWQRVIELVPDNTRGHTNLGAAYFHMGEYEKAIACFRRSLEIHPDAPAYSSLGTVLFYMGRFAEAVEMFERGVALGPEEPMTWGNLADACRWTTGQQERAAAAYERAIDLTRGVLRVNPRSVADLGPLAEWLAKRGRLEEADQALSRARKLDPDNLDLMARSVRVHHLAGRRQAALEALAEALRRGYRAAEFEHDPELATLRREPAYQEAIRRLQEPAK